MTLSLDDQTVTMPKAKISKVILQPQIGGMTWMACEVEAPTNLADGVESIGNHCGLKIAAHLAFGTKPVLDKRQKSLPLGEGKNPPDDDEDDDAEDPAKAKRGNGNGRGVHA